MIQTYQFFHIFAPFGFTAATPKADIPRCGKKRRYSITSPAVVISDCGIARPNDLGSLDTRLLRCSA
jgi:hypothetical protein